MRLLVLGVGVLGVHELGAHEELVGLDLARRVVELVRVTVVGRGLVADAAGNCCCVRQGPAEGKPRKQREGRGGNGRCKGGVDRPRAVGSGLTLLLLAAGDKLATTRMTRLRWGGAGLPCCLLAAGCW